jgi:hypothetical protein
MLALLCRLQSILLIAWPVASFAACVDTTAWTATKDTTAQNADQSVVTTPAYPLKVSRNNRYLVGQNDAPFLIVGDAPQTLIANLAPNEAAGYMTNRQGYCINSLWINILCNWPHVCREDATTFDGISPFLTAGDLSTPGPAYFNRVDEIIHLAAASGIVVFLDPIETSGWLGILRANGTTKAYAYGRFLGDRYRTFPNIIWMHGNDFQTWHDRTDDELVQSVARGIKDTDPVHLQTIELNYLTSASLDDPSWAPLIDLDAAYTYFPTYSRLLAEYNRPKFRPVFLVEAAYEFEHLFRTDGGSTQNLRKQEYWTMLSGAAGQLYGSAVTWRLEAGWQSRLDSPGITQLLYMRNLFAPRRWYELVPDQAHSVLISGYGSMSKRLGDFASYMGARTGGWLRSFDFIKRHTGWGSVTTNGYSPAAVTPDGSLMIAYMTSIRTVAVDLSKLRGPVRAEWYDPTNGEYRRVADSPFANTGEREFTPPGNNAAGDGDWVLVLESDR